MRLRRTLQVELDRVVYRRNPQSSPASRPSPTSSANARSHRASRSTSCAVAMRTRPGTAPGAVRVPRANSRIALRSCTTAPVRSDYARANASTRSRGPVASGNPECASTRTPAAADNRSGGSALVMSPRGGVHIAAAAPSTGTRTGGTAEGILRLPPRPRLDCHGLLDQTTRALPEV